MITGVYFVTKEVKGIKVANINITKRLYDELKDIDDFKDYVSRNLRHSEKAPAQILGFEEYRARCRY